MDEQVQRTENSIVKRFDFNHANHQICRRESLNECQPVRRSITLINECPLLSFKTVSTEFVRSSDNASLSLHFQSWKSRKLSSHSSTLKMKPDTGRIVGLVGFKARFLMCNYRFIFCWLRFPFPASKHNWDMSATMSARSSGRTTMLSSFKRFSGVQRITESFLLAMTFIVRPAGRRVAEP